MVLSPLPPPGMHVLAYMGRDVSAADITIALQPASTVILRKKMKLHDMGCGGGGGGRKEVRQWHQGGSEDGGYGLRNAPRRLLQVDPPAHILPLAGQGPANTFRRSLFWKHERKASLGNTAFRMGKIQQGVGMAAITAFILSCPAMAQMPCPKQLLNQNRHTK